MSTKQILRHYFPVFKKTFFTFSTRTYGDVYRYRHAVALFKIYHRFLCLRESALSRTFSKLSLQSANTECRRRLSYSCHCGTLHHSHFDLSSDVKKGTEHEAQKIQAAEPKLSSLVTEVEDVDDDSGKRKGETTVDEEEETHAVKKAADTSQIDKNISDEGVDVNKRNATFEYDYQVAEDIEEYDYIDVNSLMEQQIQTEKVLPISLKRGQNGVFDLHELVTLLEHLGAENIVTVPVPPEANFCDDMVVISAKSRRHLQAINEEMLWVHKRKKAKRDPYLVIEGKDKTDWCAMDLGNIVLHVFYGEMREYYDIESLWLLGPDHDPKCQEQTANPYILSAEDLFWLETGQVKGEAADQDGSPTTDNEQSIPEKSDFSHTKDNEQSIPEKSDFSHTTNNEQIIPEKSDFSHTTDNEQSISEKSDCPDKVR